MNTKTEATIVGLAAEAGSHFDTKTRENGDRFFCLADDRPEWVRDLVHEAHRELFPNDWSYNFIVEMLQAIVEEIDESEIEPSIYTSDLLEWVSSADRSFYVDELLDGGSTFTQFSDLLMAAQTNEKMEVYSTVWNFLEERMEELNA